MTLKVEVQNLQLLIDFPKPGSLPNRLRSERFSLNWNQLFFLNGLHQSTKFMFNPS
jgi:hypothetical protein